MSNFFIMISILSYSILFCYGFLLSSRSYFLYNETNRCTIMHIYNGCIVYLIYIMYICVSHTYIMRACVYLIYMYI